MKPLPALHAGLFFPSSCSEWAQCPRAAGAERLACYGLVLASWRSENATTAPLHPSPNTLFFCLLAYRACSLRWSALFFAQLSVLLLLFHGTLRQGCPQAGHWLPINWLAAPASALHKRMMLVLPLRCNVTHTHTQWWQQAGKGADHASTPAWTPLCRCSIHSATRLSARNSCPSLPGVRT
jgi:hypothetical protein